jgi:hypothetical protein
MGQGEAETGGGLKIAEEEGAGQKYSKDLCFFNFPM